MMGVVAGKTVETYFVPSKYSNGRLLSLLRDPMELPTIRHLAKLTWNSVWVKKVKLGSLTYIVIEYFTGRILFLKMKLTIEPSYFGVPGNFCIRYQNVILWRQIVSNIYPIARKYSIFKQIVQNIYYIARKYSILNQLCIIVFLVCLLAGPFKFYLI